MPREPMSASPTPDGPAPNPYTNDRTDYLVTALRYIATNSSQEWDRNIVNAAADRLAPLEAEHGRGVCP